MLFPPWRFCAAVAQALPRKDTSAQHEAARKRMCVGVCEVGCDGRCAHLHLVSLSPWKLLVLLLVLVVVVVVGLALVLFGILVLLMVGSVAVSVSAKWSAPDPYNSFNVIRNYV